MAAVSADDEECIFGAVQLEIELAEELVVEVVDWAFVVLRGADTCNTEETDDR